MSIKDGKHVRRLGRHRERGRARAARILRAVFTLHGLPLRQHIQHVGDSR